LTGAGTLAADLTVTASATLLLDLYPDAAAAYSLRKLRTAYAGSAIRVRRSSDNTEQDIGFTALNVLDEAALTTFCGVGNGFVTTWYDQSGNARNATQATAANQPRIVNSGVVELQIDKPALRFILANQQFLRTSTFNLNTPINSFSVFKYTFLNGFVFDGVSVNRHRIYTSTTTIMTLFGSDGKDNLTYNDASGVINKNYLSDFLMAGANTRWQLNNNTELLASWNNGSTDGVTFGKAGGTISTFFYTGFISEYILYPNNQNTNSINIKSNINTHYAIY
jgi:hypothetical protein